MSASRLLRGAITESRVEQRRVVLVVLRAAERHGWTPAVTADVLDALGLLPTARKLSRPKKSEPRNHEVA